MEIIKNLVLKIFKETDLDNSIKARKNNFPIIY